MESRRVFLVAQLDLTLRSFQVVPNKPMGFPTKNDHDLGCEMGVFPPFKETPISSFPPLFQAQSLPNAFACGNSGCWLPTLTGSLTGSEKSRIPSFSRHHFRQQKRCFFWKYVKMDSKTLCIVVVIVNLLFLHYCSFFVFYLIFIFVRGYVSFPLIVLPLVHSLCVSF